MKVGYNWLKEYVAFEWTPEELADRLTAIGTAVDGIEPVFEKFTNVVIGRIDKVETHPKRPDLNVCHVDLKGRGVTMVSGAPNCRKGMLVAAALPGAKLPGLDGNMEEREIDGVTSEGMLCSEKELGLSEDGSVLMEIDPEIYTVGANLWDAYGLDEVSLSFELTPNRSDCLSVIGIAREIAALVEGRVRRPETKLEEVRVATADLLRIDIDFPDGCPRYAGRIVRGGTVRPSPFWLKRCLRSAGIRPINNAVDITNFVMLETGQPLHAFDWSKFPGGRVLVRASTAGEKFTTLDDIERTLPANSVMITNGEDAVAIGGVMGGADSEVKPETKDFLIESAHFSPAHIRRTRTRLGLATDAALRFEKGVDPNGVIQALDRAAALFVQLTGGEVLAEPVDTYPAPVEPRKLELDPERANRVLGTNMSTPTMINILANLEFGVVTGKPPAITVPTFRPDIEREIDLIEEVARIYGYERIPVDRRAGGALPTHRDRFTMDARRARDMLEGMGLCEMVNNSLTDPKSTHVPKKQHVALRNPLSAELSIMRPDLIGGLLGTVARNRNRQVESIPVYELGRVFLLSPESQTGFSEHTELLIGLCGHAPTPGWGEPSRAYDYFDLKGKVEEFLRHWLPEYVIEPSDESPFARGQSFRIEADGSGYGYLGLIDANHAKRFDVKDPVWAAVINFEALVRRDHPVKRYTPAPRFPAAFRDVAVVVDPDTRAGDLERTIREAGGEVVEGVRLFDRYSGKSIAEGKISLAFSISYRVPDRTLRDDEVEEAHGRIVAALAKEHGAELRK
ncbi:MAG: phenylalanine--tRNA ligase subunit beta [Candidatus Zixiibacteriota bacterium]